MMSNYEESPEPEEVRVEKICSRCKGLGTVELHGQETDCTACDGWGSILL